MMDTFSVENLEKFVNEYKDGALKPYIKSEPLPIGNKKPVKVYETSVSFIFTFTFFRKQIFVISVMNLNTFFTKYCAKIRFLVNGFHRYWEVAFNRFLKNCSMTLSVNVIFFQETLLCAFFCTPCVSHFTFLCPTTPKAGIYKYIK